MREGNQIENGNGGQLFLRGEQKTPKLGSDEVGRPIEQN